MIKKECTTCKEVKDLDDFPKYSENSKQAGRHRPVCRSCHNLRAKQWRQANPEKHLAGCETWRRNNLWHGRNKQHRRRMRMKENDYMPRNGWEALLVHYGAACMKCGETDRLELDHVIPLSLNGDHALWNAQVLCKSCNSAKHNKSTADYRDKATTGILVDCVGF